MDALLLLHGARHLFQDLQQGAGYQNGTIVLRIEDIIVGPVSFHKIEFLQEHPDAEGAACGKVHVVR